MLAPLAARENATCVFCSAASATDSYTELAVRSSLACSTE
eukprot:CAMPEP_0173182404 /NCGR_PEP_ID=MMETSP1141-20130122/7816_1 /TAXON_ID=483371 /ORGANISM="non described non described, Strain CCMP2298" /LENGTH=39 /DNA_ID= /DNA_START= /DNA_END= /DNA_ORIENTATION=